MLLQGIAYFMIVLMIEAGIFRSVSNALSSKKPVTVGSLTNLREDHEDDDVADERKRITSEPIDSLFQTDSLIMKVSHVYNF